MNDIAVCVIGAGPRGTSVVERLVANAGELVGGRLRIDVVDPCPPGPGRIWQVDQPSHLLMNTLAARATLFTDETVPCVGPVVVGPNLYEWARERGEPLEPWSHPSRALLGRYYAWFFDRVVASAPEHVEVCVHRARALALEDGPTGQRVRLDNGATIVADSVILTVGHSDLRLDDHQADLARFAAERGLLHLPPANPLEWDLTAIRPGERVLVQGLGMNFFDLMARLSIGRGGTFRDGRYEPSGREPVLYVGSRRGVPYRAKPIYGALPPPARPRHLTDAAVAKLRGGVVDFRRDVWPLIAADAVEAHLRAGGDGVVDFASWGRPLAGRSFEDAASFHAWMLRDLRDDLAEAARGAASPVKAAAASIGASRTRVRVLAADGGLDPAAVHRFRGFAASLASGPPASRVAELLALAEAGVVRFVGPDMTVEADARRGVFVGRSPAVKAGPIEARVVVEARLPEPDIRRSADPLLAHLFATGQVRPYADTGALDVTASPFRPKNATGLPHPARFVLGIPLEGRHFLTALGAEPGTGAAFLVETDAVARAALLA